jgi:hypothetical protein
MHSVRAVSNSFRPEGLSSLNRWRIDSKSSLEFSACHRELHADDVEGIQRHPRIDDAGM